MNVTEPEPIWRYFELSTAEGVGTRRAQILYPSQTGGVAVVVTLSLKQYKNFCNSKCL